MYARKFRVPVREFFEQRAEARTHTPHFTLLVQDTPLEHARFAVVIQGKTNKGAVGRHTLKRRVAGRTKLWQSQTHKGKRGKDFVVVVMPGSDTLSSQELTRELSELWEKYPKN